MLLSMCCAASVGGCAPPTAGECGEDAARQVVFTADDQGLPAYVGQALVNRSCGAGSQCHSEGIRPTDRHGAPAGMDFDLSLAGDGPSTERLRRAQAEVYRLQRHILQAVDRETMPPGAIGAAVEAGGPAYLGLPEITSDEGREALRNWLACGAPVVERASANRPDGTEPVGAIVPARPMVPPEGCETPLSECDGTCVDTSSNPNHCGACGAACDGAELCASGACSAECPAGTTECDRACVQTATDAFNCGACAVVCDSGRACAGGACACAGGLAECDGLCVDTQTTPAHCGGCGNDCGPGAGCESGSCATCGEGVSFAGDIQPVFDASCNGSMCHGGARPSADLDLTAGRSHGALVGVTSGCSSSPALVAPGLVADSYLVDKLRGTDLCMGRRMPLQAAALPETTIATIEDWICGGARND